MHSLTPVRCTGYDADLVIKIKALPLSACAGRFTARAGALQIEDGTNRPILGDIEFCELNPEQFQFDLTTATHEMLHILVRPRARTLCMLRPG